MKKINPEKISKKKIIAINQGFPRKNHLRKNQQNENNQARKNQQNKNNQVKKNQQNKTNQVKKILILF